MLPLFYTNNLRAFSRTLTRTRHTLFSVKDIQCDSEGKPISWFIIKFKFLQGFSSLFARPANPVNIYLFILR